MWRQEERSMGTSIRATFDWDEGDAVYILVGQKGTSVCDEVILIDSLQNLHEYIENTLRAAEFYLVPRFYQMEG